MGGRRQLGDVGDAGVVDRVSGAAGGARAGLVAMGGGGRHGDDPCREIDDKTRYYRRTTRAAHRPCSPACCGARWHRLQQSRRRRRRNRCLARYGYRRLAREDREAARAAVRSSGPTQDPIDLHDRGDCYEQALAPSSRPRRSCARPRPSAADAKAAEAKAPNPQQEKMTACNKQAGDKKGDERKAFMKTCLSARPPRR